MDYRIELPDNCEMYIGEFHSLKAEISRNQRKIEEHTSSGISLCSTTKKGLEYRVIDSLEELDRVDEKLKNKPNYILPHYKTSPVNSHETVEDVYHENGVDAISEDSMICIYQQAADILKSNGFKLNKLLLDEETANYSIWAGGKKKGMGTYKVFSPGIEFVDPTTSKVFLQYDVFEKDKIQLFLESIQHIQRVQDEISTKCLMMLTPNAFSSLLFALLFYMSGNHSQDEISQLCKIPILSKVIINSTDNKIVQGTVDGDGNYYTSQTLLQNDNLNGLAALRNQRWKVDYKAAPICRPHKISVEKGEEKLAHILNSRGIALVNDLKFENSIDFNTMNFFSIITINIYKEDLSIVGQRSLPYKGNVIHILQHIKEITYDRQYGANMILAPYALTDIEI